MNRERPPSPRSVPRAGDDLSRVKQDMLLAADEARRQYYHRPFATVHSMVTAFLGGMAVGLICSIRHRDRRD